MLRLVRIIIVATFTAGVAGLEGQGPAPQTPVPGATSAASAQPATPRLTLTAGRSQVLTTDFDVSTVTITDEEIANVTPINFRNLLIDGKKPGTVSLIVFRQDMTFIRYDLVVDPAVSILQRQMQTIFPSEQILVTETPDAVILTGRVTNNQIMLQAGNLATTLAPKAKLLNLLQLPGGGGSQQVSLQVRVAEVNRRALRELGASFFTGATGYRDIIARGTTQQFPAPNFENLQRTKVGDNPPDLSGEIVFTDFLNLFIFNSQLNVGTLIRALQTSGNFQTLAEPNIVAYNGKEATFLSGGEVPVPIVQGNQGGLSVQYKEFGIKVAFTPTIAGDLIRLVVSPEVSSLDFANGVSLGGFRVPALTTRRATTEVELRDGQTFAIGGLMNNTAQETRQSVPLLSRIPLLGYLFRSKATLQEQTELLVLVTPHLVQPLNPDQVPPLPTVPGRFLPPCDKPPCDGVDPAKKPGGGPEWPSR
jgi:pilus assembly protein CpaC